MIGYIQSAKGNENHKQEFSTQQDYQSELKRQMEFPRQAKAKGIHQQQTSLIKEMFL